MAANQLLLSSSTVGFGGGEETATAPTGTVQANFSILAETLRQRGNRVVTNKQCGIRFAFLVMTNAAAMVPMVSLDRCTAVHRLKEIKGDRAGF